jgi:hypothetical protein
VINYPPGDCDDDNNGDLNNNGGDEYDNDNNNNMTVIKMSIVRNKNILVELSTMNICS